MNNGARRFGRFASYANVMSTVAVISALGGSAYAATVVMITNPHQVGTGVIVSRNLKNGAAVKLADLTTGARKALQGKTGPQGPAGATGPTGAAGTSVFGATIPSGQTVTGAWGGRYIAPQAPYNNSYLISYSLPAKAPAPLGDLDVNTASNTAAGDPDTSCTGSVDAPTAPAGKVCIYIGNAVNAQVTGFSLIKPGSNTTQPGDDYGFVVRILDTGTTGNTATTAAEGTWAYTAP
jgi:hypothetical protein